MPDLATKIADLPKLKAYARAFERLGVQTVQDLLLHLPFRLEGYGKELVPEQNVLVVGKVKRISARRTWRKGVELAEATIESDNGRLLTVVWFNQPWQAGKYPVGSRVAVAGKVSRGYGGLPQLQNPIVELLGRDGEGPQHMASVMPVYHATAKLASERIAELVQPYLSLADSVPDLIPDEIRARHRLMRVGDAIRQGHKPDSDGQWERAVARNRFAALLELQVAFLIARRQLQSEPATPIPYRQEVIDRFKAGLGFQLTRAQRRATWEVFKDLQLTVPMNRLLNGDVGAGKTAVAAAAAAMAHASDMQTVVMAPTEILARQHLGKFRAYLETSFPDLKVDLLVSGLPAAERRRVMTSVASGHTALLVGTHALIEAEVDIPKLGLAVVDEQHRFGTRQRELLRQKGAGRPHFLAMTATPIPRTLALALYGEMTVSILNELPPGRTAVTTRVVEPDERDEAYQLVRREVRAGRQAFVICPLIEESEQLEVKAATVEFERLRSKVFPDLRLALVHGKLKDKDETMRRFAAAEVDVLVATPVVEVGVDVPNATVMMIEGAERFGLAQLHQFRGRVGRGAHVSHCLLLADDPSEKTAARLDLLTHEHNGFRLAEKDLELRGMGELMGARQHGMSDEAMRALAQPQLLNEVREEAELLVARDPDLATAPVLRDAVERRLNETSIS